MTLMERVVCQTIKEIQNKKRRNGEFPDFALHDEVYNSLKGYLLEAECSLCQRGLITIHKTVNGIPMFGIKD